MSVNHVPGCVEAKCNHAAQSSSMGSEKMAGSIKSYKFAKKQAGEGKRESIRVVDIFIRSPW